MRFQVIAAIPLFLVAACSSPKAAVPRLPVPAIPEVSTWAIDPENSSVTFVCKHVFTNVRGMFQKPSGTITLDAATAANSTISATIDVGSITTGVEERDTHLKTADFFDAATYPTITFDSTAFASHEVTGTLTMHGVSKPVTLAIVLSDPFTHAGGIRRSITGSTTVNRRDFGIVWDFPGEGTGVVVGDMITITVDAELVLQP